ncbi:DUF2203 domain-containing protein [Roseimaritima sediminicola]|uniref:DUF2203 domain-containing protein n=1 Tax=Roseimaritima sediminicola TaxID=2662066 RepID=UPI0012982F1F|nr:DUF2203 domain-containing protein [Roseimaritima sediminicola]
MVKAIPQHSGYFTAEQANEMLPLLRRIVRDWMRLSDTVQSQQAQREGLKMLHQTVDRKAYSEELAEVEQSLVEDHDRLEDCCEELRSLGVELHSPEDGSVDFPALLDGREVRLCWRAGEPTVEYWHEIGQPHARRRYPGSHTSRMGIEDV